MVHIEAHPHHQLPEAVPLGPSPDVVDSADADTVRYRQDQADEERGERVEDESEHVDALAFASLARRRLSLHGAEAEFTGARGVSGFEAYSTPPPATLQMDPRAPRAPLGPFVAVRVTEGFCGRSRAVGEFQAGLLRTGAFALEMGGAHVLREGAVLE